MALRRADRDAFREKDEAERSRSLRSRDRPAATQEKKEGRRCPGPPSFKMRPKTKRLEPAQTTSTARSSRTTSSSLCWISRTRRRRRASWPYCHLTTAQPSRHLRLKGPRQGGEGARAGATGKILDEPRSPPERDRRARTPAPIDLLAPLQGVGRKEYSLRSIAHMLAHEPAPDGTWNNASIYNR